MKELNHIKEGQGKADDYAAFEAFMEINGSVNEPRDMQYLLWKQGRTAPPSTGDAVSVPRELLERVLIDHPGDMNDVATLVTFNTQIKQAREELRALIAQQGM